MKKSKTSKAKILTGENIQGLNKNKVKPKYAYGDLFSQVDKHMQKNMSAYTDGGVSNKISTLMKEGYSQDQAVAIALNMNEKREVGSGGTWKGEYPNGGEVEPTDDSDFISMPELVRPGSSRLKELKKMELKRAEYEKKLEQLSPYTTSYGDPNILSREEFIKKYPDAGAADLPEDVTTVYGFSTPEGVAPAWQSERQRLMGDRQAGLIGSFADKTSAPVTFFPGPEPADEVPDYEVLDPMEDVDMTLAPEKTYRKIPGLGYVYGYQDDPEAPLEFVNKDIYNRPDSNFREFQYQDEQFNVGRDERVSQAISNYVSTLPKRPQPPVEEIKDSSTEYVKQKPGALYKDSEGKNVRVPEDAVWWEEKGVYQDREGNIYNPREGTVTRLSTYDSTKGKTETPTFEGGGEYKNSYYQTLGNALRETFGGQTFAEGGESKPSVQELLTGEEITSLEGDKNIQPNAELEKDEYVKFPDEATQKVVGEKHSKGGVDMHIPDGTKILSDKRKLTGDQAKKLKKEYDIKITSKNTYAEALDAYVKKIGLRKLYDDQEQLFEQLDKVVKDSFSEGSKRVNKEYLSKKIHNIEKQKEDKESLKTDFFDSLFTMQEVAKRPDEKEEMEQFFEQGGISREAFKNVVNKYGLSEREGIDLYNGKMPERLLEKKQDGGIKKYPNGGEHEVPKTLDEVQELYESGKITREEADRYEVELANIAAAPPVSFTTTLGSHEFSNEDVYVREEQSAGDAAFGNITEENLPMVLNNLYRNFPDIVAEEYGVVYNDDGTIEFDSDINFSEASEKVKHFQERANKRMTETANMIISNPDAFDAAYVQSAEDYLKNETFDESLARGIDSKLGNFTSGRYTLGIDVVTPDEKKELESKGIFTTNQLQNAIDGGDIKLSEGSLNRLEKLRTLTPEGADVDFTINTIAPVEEGKTPEETPPGETPIEEGPIEDTVNVPGKEYPRLFFTPDQSPLPPSAMEAHLLNQIKLQRIDPTRIGVETELQQASDAIKEGTAALDHLPPNQRAAAIVGLQANVQKGINEAIHSANVTNAQNLASAELFNIGQSGQEEQLRANNLLSFEQRQLTAKAKTEEEVRRYYDQLNRIAINNFRNQQDLNLLNTLAPDYSINSTGTGVDFTPEGEFKLQDNSKYKDLFG